MSTDLTRDLPPLPVWSEAQFREDCERSGLEPSDPHMLEAYGWGFQRAVRLLRAAPLPPGGDLAGDAPAAEGGAS